MGVMGVMGAMGAMGAMGVVGMVGVMDATDVTDVVGKENPPAHIDGTVNLGRKSRSSTIMIVVVLAVGEHHLSGDYHRPFIKMVLFLERLPVTKLL
jgi:hypothetical protein